MERSPKLLFFILVSVMSIIIMIRFNTGDFNAANHQANRFLNSIYNGRYKEAYSYVDQNKISLEELKEAGTLSRHCYRGATFFYDSKDYYAFGFKPHGIVKRLEFYISKVNNEWKIKCLSYAAETDHEGVIPKDSTNSSAFWSNK